MRHPDSVVSCESYPDHNIVLVNISSQLNYSTRKIHLFKKANWDVIRYDLLLTFHMYFNLKSTSSRKIGLFHQQYLYLVQKYVLLKNIKYKMLFTMTVSFIKTINKEKAITI